MTEGDRQPGSVGRGPALLLVLTGLLGVGGACLLGARGLEPFATWLYPFAWYPLLLGLEGAVALRRGSFLVLDRPRALASLLAWSVPTWMVFELLNLRLRNWYYVLVPEPRALAWLGIVLSFATVLPAVFLPAALTDLAGRERRDREEAGAATSSSTRGLRLAGALCLLLPMAWPGIFFPLVWAAPFALLEPDLQRRFPSASLLVDLRRGRGGRLLALLAGGALAGLFWESLNWLARARWIYTVPGLERVKLFEMPPLGFLGFPVLALSAHAAYQWLVLQGAAEPVGLRRPPPLPARAGRTATRLGSGAVILAPVLVLAALLGMERWSISSRSAHLRDLPGLLPHEVEDLVVWGVESPFQLAEYDPERLAEAVPGVSPREAAGWIEAARLAVTRGIGTRNARLLHAWGVETPEKLARVRTEALVRCFEGVGPPPVRRAQIRVWQRAVEVEAGGNGAIPEPECGREPHGGGGP